MSQEDNYDDYRGQYDEEEQQNGESYQSEDMNIEDEQREDDQQPIRGDDDADGNIQDSIDDDSVTYTPPYLLYVQEIPSNSTEEDVKAAFVQFGDVEKIVLTSAPLSKKIGGPNQERKLVAHITFTDASGLASVLSFNREHPAKITLFQQPLLIERGRHAGEASRQNKLYIGRIPDTIIPTEVAPRITAHLTQLYQQLHGADAKLPFYIDEIIPKLGCAFITVVPASESENVITLLNDSELDGVTLRCEHSSIKRKESNTLYVSGLKPTATQDDIAKFFITYGLVVNVATRIPPSTPDSLFAFVTFKNIDDATKAIDDLHDKPLDPNQPNAAPLDAGKPLQVEYAKPRPGKDGTMSSFNNMGTRSGMGMRNNNDSRFSNRDNNNNNNNNNFQFRNNNNNNNFNNNNRDGNNFRNNYNNNNNMMNGDRRNSSYDSRPPRRDGGMNTNDSRGGNFNNNRDNNNNNFSRNDGGYNNNRNQGGNNDQFDQRPRRDNFPNNNNNNTNFSRDNHNMNNNDVRFNRDNNNNMNNNRPNDFSRDNHNNRPNDFSRDNTTNRNFNNNNTNFDDRRFDNRQRDGGYSNNNMNRPNNYSRDNNNINDNRSLNRDNNNNNINNQNFDDRQSRPQQRQYPNTSENDLDDRRNNNQGPNNRFNNNNNNNNNNFSNNQNPQPRSIIRTSQQNNGGDQLNSRDRNRDYQDQNANNNRRFNNNNNNSFNNNNNNRPNNYPSTGYSNEEQF